MLPDIINIANQWHPSIQVELAHADRENVPYLDVSLTIQKHKIQHTLFRKQLSSYHYPPALSAHLKHVLSGIAAGETSRIVKQFPNTTTIRKEFGFLRKCMHARGHRSAAVDAAMARMGRKPISAFRRPFGTLKTQKRVRKAYLLTTFSSGVRAKRIHSSLQTST